LKNSIFNLDEVLKEKVAWEVEKKFHFSTRIKSSCKNEGSITFGNKKLLKVDIGK
jgi:hypothetical protein